MISFRARFVPCLCRALVGASLAVTFASAQVPSTLRHTLLNPSTNAQVGAQQGYSVAIDGNLAVAGAPYDDAGAYDCGQVKVYDASTGALLHILPNPSPAAFDGFGTSVAISGTRVVVGAPYDDTGAMNAGSAYVFDLAGGNPAVPVVTLTNPGPANSDFFAFDVAISGQNVVVGAHRDDTGADNAGSVYVYNLTSATPALPVLTLTNPTPVAIDWFGYSVAVSGNKVLIGAHGDDHLIADAGTVYVYDIDSPSPEANFLTLHNPHPEERDWFGYSVAISGARLAIGAPADDGSLFNSGSAYVYDLGSGAPTVPVAMLTNPIPTLDSYFGIAVSISGSRALVGAPADDTGTTDAGMAYLFDLTSGTIDQPVMSLTNPIPADSDLFGFAVAISGDRVFAGAYADDTWAPDAGSAYLYNLSGATPTVPIATANQPSLAASEQFGFAVAVSSNLVLIGTPYDNSTAPSAGSAHLYDLSSGSPTVPLLTLANPSPNPTDAFAFSVALDGRRALAGAPRDDTGAVDAGSAYVYNFAGATPAIPTLVLTNPGPAVQDLFGSALALSGTRAVVGAWGDNTGANDAGSAYVYDLGSATPTVPLTLPNPSPAAGDAFGFSVAISGTRVVIGAWGDDTGASNAGIAYVYQLAGPTPTIPVLTLTNPSPLEGNFGRSIAISGTRVLIGAAGEEPGATNTGRAYVYDLAGATPSVPVVTLANPGTSGANFGRAVAIRGTILVVGASGDDLAAADSGRAYVYDLSGATPAVPAATLTNSSPAALDYFGSAVALDDTVVVGAHGIDANAVDRGAAYIYGAAQVQAATLAIAPDAPGFATISWTPPASTGFVLQYTDNLAPSNWVNAPSGMANPVTVPASGNRRFYRLFKP